MFAHKIKQESKKFKTLVKFKEQSKWNSRVHVALKHDLFVNKLIKTLSCPNVNLQVSFAIPATFLKIKNTIDKCIFLSFIIFLTQ